MHRKSLKNAAFAEIFVRQSSVPLLGELGFSVRHYISNEAANLPSTRHLTSLSLTRRFSASTLGAIWWTPLAIGAGSAAIWPTGQRHLTLTCGLALSTGWRLETGTGQFLALMADKTAGGRTG